MVRGVADTHTLIWSIYDDPRLSGGAADFIDEAAIAGDSIAVSSMTLIEITYLVEKGRLGPTTLDRIVGLIGFNGPFEEVAVGPEVARAVAAVPRDEVPHLPDRVLAATAVHLGVPLISRDGKVRASSVPTIW